MTNLIILQPGEMLRMAITRAGYRGCITNLGLDKDLDDVALGARPSSTCDLLVTLEDACQKQLQVDCGEDWALYFHALWLYALNTFQHLAKGVDTSAIADEQGQNEVLRCCVVPMLSETVLAATQRSAGSGPVSGQWWAKPFESWATWAAKKGDVGIDALLNNLIHYFESSPDDVSLDMRSVERWRAGEPVGRLRWPYRPAVKAMLGKELAERLGAQVIDQLTGWLIVTVAVQSLPSEMRELVRLDFRMRSLLPWSLKDVIHHLNQYSSVRSDHAAHALVAPLLQKIEELFSVSPNAGEIKQNLDAFQTLINRETAFLQRSHQYIHDWFSARLAAISDLEADALRLYDKAVAGVWWYGGTNQHPVINEALNYAVGMGKKIAAENYWDKTFLLGLNTWPKHPLDEQEIRRLSFGFERLFAPRKAKSRIPPSMELIVKSDGFEVTAQALARPNSKIKHAEGRTRRTPLMDAIREGSLSDVQRMLDAGGDPNDFITESGESPLSYAMRRACDRKDTVIMDHLLTLALLPETVNRPASTKRETPLKIAIEMANPIAVQRLISLQANVEANCDYLPSALCYSMSLLYGSIHPDDDTQERAYFAGKGPADVYDAKDGAVLDADLADRRQKVLALRNSSSMHRNSAAAVRRYFLRPADDLREVVRVLLRHGANANRRYKVDPAHAESWTPTLFAAQMGDIDVFRDLVEHKGDPQLTLVAASSLERKDALWVAIGYKRHSIVAYLTELQH